MGGEEWLPLIAHNKEGSSEEKHWRPLVEMLRGPLLPPDQPGCGWEVIQGLPA